MLKKHSIFNFVLTLLAFYIAFLLFNTIYERVTWIFSNYYPPSTDGFFYLQEFKSRLYKSSSYYSPYSAFFIIAGIIGKVFTLTPEALYQLLAFFSMLLLPVAIILALRKNILAAMLLSVTCISSDLYFYRSYAFLEQSVSLGLFAIAFFFAWEASLVNKAKVKNGLILVAGILFVLAASMHLSVCFLSILALLGLLYCQKQKILALIISCLSLIAGFTFLTNTSRPIFASSQQSFMPGLFQACTFISCSQHEWSELVLFSVILSLSIFLVIRNKGKDYFLLYCLLVIGFLNAPLWTTEGHMLYRLALTSIWFVFLAASRLLVAKEKSSNVFLVLLIGYVYFQSELKVAGYRGPSVPADFLSTNSTSIKQWLPINSFILAPHGQQFRVTYFWDRPSAGKMPLKSKFDQYFKLTNRVSRGIKCEYLDKEVTNVNSFSCLSLESGWYLLNLGKGS